jgi:hypothetical protein
VFDILGIEQGIVWIRNETLLDLAKGQSRIDEATIEIATSAYELASMMRKK